MKRNETKRQIQFPNNDKKILKVLDLRVTCSIRSRLTRDIRLFRTREPIKHNDVTFHKEVDEQQHEEVMVVLNFESRLKEQEILVFESLVDPIF
jgi:hypothetical protein